MKKITAENLHEFAPSYEGSYAERVEHFAEKIGVEGDPSVRDYAWGLNEWNERSAIGFSQEELGIVNLIYSVAKNNQRYDNDDFIDPTHGGNTAEHPVFIGVALDEYRDKAGFGPAGFNADSADNLQAAQTVQRVHAMISVHDVGELVDVSYGEMHAVGASKKEPDEEELVAPFQLKMAAYALSVGQPELYVELVTDLKQQALAAKQKHFERAKSGEITGDEFISEFGKELGALIESAEDKIDESKISPAFQDAVDTLYSLNLEAEHANTLPGVLFSMLDRIEGNLHYARYAGRAAKEYGETTPEADAEKRMLNRLFDSGRSMSYLLADSKSTIDQMNFAQKNIIQAFAQLEKEPEETREVAEKLVREVAAGLMRARIPLLQKAAPFIDFTDAGKAEPKASPSGDRAEQVVSFEARLNTQRALRDAALPNLKTRDGVDVIEGVMDTKALIAVVEKAAQAIEAGYTPPSHPKSLVIPLGSELPEEFRVSSAEIRETAKQYPLEAAQDFSKDQFKGAAVRI